ncbi:MAG: CCA tRNA nucleotidyltransferase [Lachnospira pectinoschiza]
MDNYSMAIQIAKKVKEVGGIAYFVGGYVRDSILDIPNKDIDIEIHGIKPEILKNILSELGDIQTIGNAFGIYNLKGYDLDIALPRKERCIGTGHKDFEVYVDPYIGTHAAARRRDFTINALMKNILTGEIIDEFNGLNDLKNHIIRHVDSSTFREDSLRVLRACQFAARFNFKIASETINLCKTMDLSTMPKERIAGELSKALLKAKKPSVFFNSLYECEQTKWFKEVYALKGIKQDSEYHPEGDVYMHTMSVLDQAGGLFPTGIDNPDRYLPFMLSALCHDFGKVNTTEINSKGRLCALNHEITGIPIANDFLGRIYNNKGFIKYVDNMIKYHMKAHSCFNNRSKTKTTNLMFDKLLYPKDFILLVYADSTGHDLDNLDNRQFNMFLEKAMTESGFLTDRYLDYGKRISESHITAEDLINIGLKPSPLFKIILDKAWDMHLKGIKKEHVLKQVADILTENNKAELLSVINNQNKKERDNINADYDDFTLYFKEQDNYDRD